MMGPLDDTPCLSLPDVARRITGTVLVSGTSFGLLGKLELCRDDPGRRILMFFHDVQEAVKAKDRVAEEKLRSFSVLVGEAPARAPLARRSVSAVVTSLPYIEESERLRYLRKAAGLLVDDGLLILHARLRGKVSGLGEHAGRVLFAGGTGLPDELVLTSLVLRSGFNRIERRKLGRFKRRTMVLARKNVL